MNMITCIIHDGSVSCTTSHIEESMIETVLAQYKERAQDCCNASDCPYALYAIKRYNLDGTYYMHFYINAPRTESQIDDLRRMPKDYKIYWVDKTPKQATIRKLKDVIVDLLVALKKASVPEGSCPKVFLSGEGSCPNNTSCMRCSEAAWAKYKRDVVKAVAKL